MKKTAKKGLFTVIALITVLAVSVSAFAAGFTRQDAQKLALKDAGVKAKQVRQLKSELDGRYFEVDFTVKNDKTEYEYEITKDGRIKKVDIEYYHKFNPSKEKISKTAAKKAAAKAAGVKLSKVKAGTCRFKINDGEGIWKLTFKSGNCRYTVEVLAPTGKVIGIERKYTL